MKGSYFTPSIFNSRGYARTETTEVDFTREHVAVQSHLNAGSNINNGAKARVYLYLYTKGTRDKVHKSMQHRPVRDSHAKQGALKPPESRLNILLFSLRTRTRAL